MTQTAHMPDLNAFKKALKKVIAAQDGVPVGEEGEGTEFEELDD